MRKLQNTAAVFFICAVFILTIVSVFGVWDLFDGDVVWKSFQTLGLLSLVALIIIKAGKVMDDKAGSVTPPLQIFSSLRKMAFAILIVPASPLALLGVMSIWDVIADKDVLYKSLGSLVIIAFSAGVVKVTCDAMEGEDRVHAPVVASNPISAPVQPQASSPVQYPQQSVPPQNQ